MAIAADVKSLLRRIATILDEYALELGQSRADYHLRGWLSEEWGHVVVAFACAAFNDKPTRPFLDEIRDRLVSEFGDEVGRQVAVLPSGYSGPGTEPSLPGFDATMVDVSEYLVPEPRVTVGESN